MAITEARIRSYESMAREVREDSLHRKNLVAQDLGLAVEELLSEREKFTVLLDSIRTNLGMTVYEGTPVSVWSGKHIVRAIDAVLNEGGRI